MSGRIHRLTAEVTRGAAGGDDGRAARRHRAHLRPGRIDPRDVALFLLLVRDDLVDLLRLVALVALVVFVARALAQLDQHELALGVEPESDQARAEQRNRRLAQLRDRRRQRDRVLGVLLGDAVEERHRLRREQRDLLLLHEHGELRGLRAGLQGERPLARLADRAGSERVDRVELDRVRHRQPPRPAPRANRSSLLPTADSRASAERGRRARPCRCTSASIPRARRRRTR